MSADAGLCCV